MWKQAAGDGGEMLMLARCTPHKCIKSEWILNVLIKEKTYSRIPISVSSPYVLKPNFLSVKFARNLKHFKTFRLVIFTIGSTAPIHFNKIFIVCDRNVWEIITMTDGKWRRVFYLGAMINHVPLNLSLHKPWIELESTPTLQGACS